MAFELARLKIAVDSTDVNVARGAMGRMEQAGSALEGMVKKLVVAWGSWKLVQYAKDAAIMAARYETLGVVVNVVGRNAGYTATQMAGFEKGLQKAGISMIESRNTLAVMAQAHIDLAKSTDLARIAQDAAVIGNINSSEAFQRLVYGIQSGQTEILRTIGLNVSFEQSYDKLAAQLGKTSKELTEVEKTQARTNAVMAKAPDIAGAYEASMTTTGKLLLSMKRYGEDLQVVLGDMFGGALSVGVDELNGGLKSMKEWLEKNKEASAAVKENLKGASIEFVGIVKDAMALAGAASDVTGEFTLMEIAAGGVRLVVALIRDVANSVLGIVQMVVGTLESAALLVPKLGSELGKLVGIKPPKWLDAGTYWDAAQRMFASGKERFGAKALDRFYNGEPEPLAGDSGYRRAPMSAAEVLAAEKAARGKGTGGTGTGDGKKEKGWTQGFYDIQDQEADVAEWSRNYLQKIQETEAAAAAYAKQYMDERTDYFLEKAQQDAEAQKGIYSDMFGDMTNTLHTWAEEGKDALTDFITTGKADFRGMIDAWIMDLARLAAQNGLKDLAGSMSGSSNSWLSAIGSWFGGAFADGGDPPMGKVSLVGERGPELFVPKTAGTIVPAGGLGGVQSTVNVTVNNSGVQSDAKGDAALGRDLEAAVLEVIHKHKRQGGALAEGTA